MCNAVSEAVSLYNDGREVLKGNLTKIPEALIETTRILKAVKPVSDKYNPKQDSYVKKAWDFADKNSDNIELVMGLVNLRKDKDKVRNGSSFLAGFAVSKGLEKCMETEKGEKILGKISEAVPKGISKVFNLNSEKAKKVVDISKMLISGVLYQVASDKVGELASGFTEKMIDNLRKSKKLI